MSRAVAVRDNVVQMAERAGMTRDQIELFKRTRMPEGATDDELALVLSFAREKQLSLLAGDVYAIRSGGKRLAFCATIDGFRKIAARAGGIKFSKLEWTGNGRTWVDVWLKRDKQGKEVPPAAARSLIETMDGARYETVVRWSDFYAPTRNGNGAWERMGAHMLGKVAEAHGLRRAFPEALGQLYESSEMDQAKRDSAGSTPPPVEVGRTDAERKAEREFQAEWRRYLDLRERAGWPRNPQGAQRNDPKPKRSEVPKAIAHLEQVVAELEEERAEGLEPEGADVVTIDPSTGEVSKPWTEAMQAEAERRLDEVNQVRKEVGLPVLEPASDRAGWAELRQRNEREMDEHTGKGR